MKGVVFEAPGANPKIIDSTTPQPESDQILVKSLYTAMNPVDSFVADMGLLALSWPVGLGADASGIVVEVGKEASETYGFKKGDYVCGCTRIGVSPEYTTSREYFLMDAAVTMRKPSNLTIAEACTIGAAFQTAALAVFEGLKVDPSDTKTREDWLLVFGGAGSVGGAAVQLATACGHRVITTCSGKTFAKAKANGATSVVDYRKPLDEQVNAVIEATGGKVTKIFDATSADNPALAKAVFHEVQDTPKLFATTNDWSNVGQWEGGSTYEVHLGLIGREEGNEINDALAKYNPLIPSMFEEGKVRPQEYEEIGSGLDAAMKAYRHKGDGRKVIVKIQDE